jgi:hypothetical protein
VDVTKNSHKCFLQQTGAKKKTVLLAKQTLPPPPKKEIFSYVIGTYVGKLAKKPFR